MYDLTMTGTYLVVTKGDQYDVREKSSSSANSSAPTCGGVRNLGKPVALASRYYREGAKTGNTGIEQISNLYGAQAVVISIDPQRVYIDNTDFDAMVKKGPAVIYLEEEGLHCWYQCTVKGGREARDICAVTVARASEALGAGEIMLNCINMDGQGKGFDHVLMKAVSDAVTIPVIASSGAGNAEHFSKVFSETGVQAALAAGIFHREEVGIDEVKKHMESCGIPSCVCFYHRAYTVWNLPISLALINSSFD